jgi:glyceraldehyde 3-phosphate dehydrogenase
MSTKVAINGLGRIGRAILKLVMDERSFELVAVNDLFDAESLAYLLRFDTVYGRYSKPVVVDGGDLVVAGRAMRTSSAILARPSSTSSSRGSSTGIWSRS